ncbi:MAG: hypothetical protein IPP29_05805 [Bacteroidetes bacterium]|nr:hypothetical protein [Bacteroidota bacterium]
MDGFQGTNHTFEYDIAETGVAYITNTLICDSLGNLLFYTNGWEVADSTGYIMLNGANIIFLIKQQYFHQVWHGCT